MGRRELDSSDSRQGPIADFVNAVINIHVPQKTGRFLTSLGTASFFINDSALLA